MITFLLALLAFLGWGLNDALSIKLFRQNDPAKITVASGIFRMFGWLILLPFFIGDFNKITYIPAVYNLIAGFSSGLGYYLFGKASQKTNPMLVTSISGGWGVSAVILGLLIFSEKFNSYQLISTIIVFIGLFLVTVKIESIKGIKRKKDTGIYYALATFLVWGICGALLKYPAIAYGWYWTSVIMLIPYLVIILFIERREASKIQSLIKIRNFKLYLAMIICIILGDLGYNSSFSLGGSVLMVGTIGGSYAVLSTVLAYFLYKEKLNKQQMVGVILTLLGIVGVAISSTF